ncbi:MAG TPA: DUF4912 domain-containing protein [Candidatus Omnitrophota bacterium]|nr:DUF4912 domain-containing protein [Candidatus Omnitrophota bacterium]
MAKLKTKISDKKNPRTNRLSTTAQTAPSSFVLQQPPLQNLNYQPIGSSEYHCGTWQNAVSPERNLQANNEYIPVQPPKLRKSIDLNDSTLPDLSQATRLRLMARDPHWIHAYWHVSPSAIDDAQRVLGGHFKQSRYVLRMHDITSVHFNGRNANRSFDIEVDLGSKSWYVDTWQDNASYCAQIGLKTSQGEFYQFAESNPIHTPRSSFSDRGDLIWLDVKPESSKMPFILVDTSGKRRRSGRIRWYLTEDDIRAYYSKLFPILRKILAGKIGLRKRLARLLGKHVEGDDDLLLSLHNNAWIRKMLLGASEELLEQGEGTAKALDINGSVTSWGGSSERISKQRKFFFELATELIVYGRTEPDAHVLHGSKHVPLRPDGTFSMRFALADDGFIPLDFKAISSDKIEIRKILTSAKRAKTNYQTEIS